jgi:hypothetical protein
MIARELYNDILRLTDMTEGRFVGLYNMAVSELCTTYGEKFVLCLKDEGGMPIDKIKTVNDEAIHYPEYNGAIINGILFLDDSQKIINENKSIALAKDANQKVWKKMKTEKYARPKTWL